MGDIEKFFNENFFQKVKPGKKNSQETKLKLNERMFLIEFSLQL